MTTDRILSRLVAALSAVYLVAYLAVAMLRLGYPFDLEWMEGGSVDHVARVLRGEPLYGPPRMAFIPYEYPPLYFYVSALVAAVTGIGYVPLRLVSLAASLACLASLYLIVRNETHRGLPGLIAAGLFAATLRIGGAWLDLARVDSLFLALFLLATLVLRRSTSARASVIAGILLSLSYLTKQTALAMALPLVICMICVSRRRGLWLAGSLGVVAGLTTLALHVATGGWFTFYAWSFPFKHGFAAPVWTTFWTRDMFGAMPIAFTCAVLLVIWQVLRRRPEGLFWAAVFVGMVGGAYRSRLQTGGYDNVLLPAYAVVAMLFAVAVAVPLERGRFGPNARWRALGAAALLACVVQFALLAYDPRAQLPRAADRAAGEHFLAVLGSLPGEVLLPYHGYLPTVVGKPTHAHLMQVFDILKVNDEHSAQLAKEFRSAIRNAAFGAIVLDDTTNYAFMADVDASYVLHSRVFAEPGVFMPKTGGVVVRPEFVYVPGPAAPAPAGTPVQQRVRDALRRR